MYRTFRYWLYPSKAQARVLADTLDTCRDLYNSLLHWRICDYDCLGRALTRFQQQAALPGWKKTHPELKCVHSQALQDVVHRVDRSFQDFFRRIKVGELAGHPKRRDKGYDSLAYPQSGFHLEGDRLCLSKIRAIKARLHRTAKRAASRLNARVRDRRHDFAHQTGQRLVSRYGLIAVEALVIRNMVRNHCLAKSISDVHPAPFLRGAAWSSSRLVLTRKAEKVGRSVVHVNPANTSRRCSGCGLVAPKRVYKKQTRRLKSRQQKHEVCLRRLGPLPNGSLNRRRPVSCFCRCGFNRRDRVFIHALRRCPTGVISARAA